MTFDLTYSLASLIIDALENQEKRFIFDAQNNSLVDATTVKSNGELFYDLPEWTSANGFQLREDFVNNLHSPYARKELQNVLHSGRGVFKNFKNTIKQFPEVEKLWYRFKNEKMYLYIKDWYNGLREVWGLEKLDCTIEDIVDLIHNDFTFQEYNQSFYKDVLNNFSLDKDFACDWSYELKVAMFELWQKLFEYGHSLKQTGFICRALNGDFVGIITTSPFSIKATKTVLLTSFFVKESYRGLGIGNELFSMCFNDLKNHDKQYVITANIVMPDILMSLLQRNGFEKTASGFAAKIS